MWWCFIISVSGELKQIWRNIRAFTSIIQILRNYTKPCLVGWRQAPTYVHSPVNSTRWTKKRLNEGKKKVVFLQNGPFSLASYHTQRRCYYTIYVHVHIRQPSQYMRYSATHDQVPLFLTCGLIHLSLPPLEKTNKSLNICHPLGTKKAKKRGKGETCKNYTLHFLVI